MTFETSIRSIISFIDLDSKKEILARRLDIDNRELASDITFSSQGELAYVSYQGNNQVLAIETESRQIYDRIDVSRAPQSVLVDQRTDKIYVHNFLSRSVTEIGLFKSENNQFDELEKGFETTTVSR